jgi:hypothetical protein
MRRAFGTEKEGLAQSKLVFGSRLGISTPSTTREQSLTSPPSSSTAGGSSAYIPIYLYLLYIYDIRYSIREGLRFGTWGA